MDRIVHFEIPAEDPKKAIKFYQTVFGWSFTDFGDQSYWLAKTGPDEKPGINGAVLKKRAPGQPMTNNIQVDDIDKSMEKITMNGGTIVVPKTTIPGMGYSSYFKDIDGNIIGVWQVDGAAK